MVDILFGPDEVKELLNIALVPWNGKVNAWLNGTTYDSGATTTQSVPSFINPLTSSAQSVVYYANNSPVQLLSAPSTDWKGCVFSRYIENAQSDDDADTLLYDHSSPVGDWVAWEPIGPEGEPVPGPAKCALSVDNQECRKCLTHGITPLQNTKSTIEAAINELTSPTGTTNITQGLGWGWRVLSPGAPFDEADPSPEGERRQVIVLLTDGENFAGPGDGYKAVWGHGYSGQDEMDARLLELAQNVKDAGIEIYAIQFFHSSGELADLMKAVATSPDPPYYHFAPNGAVLATVFQEVANHLSELRISK